MASNFPSIAHWAVHKIDALKFHQLRNFLFHPHLSVHISLAAKEVLGLHDGWDIFERLPVIYALGRSRQHHGVDVGSN